MNKKILFLIILILAFFLIINAEYIFTKTKNNIIGAVIDDVPSIISENNHPLILLHGFNPLYSKRLSEFSLKEMQSKLSKDMDYENKGLFVDKITCIELKNQKKPIIIRASYYGELDVIKIEYYAKNLDKIISRIKYCTGAKKVDILTHSMGGIVSRYYIQNINNSSIRKLIMLGTPNQGMLYNLGNLADLFIDNGKSIINLDFIELSENHNLMKNLNEHKINENIEYYTIAGKIDDIGDGLVSEKSAHLKGGKKHITVPCRHFFMKYPSSCPQAYDFVKEVLKE